MLHYVVWYTYRRFVGNSLLCLSATLTMEAKYSAETLILNLADHFVCMSDITGLLPFIEAFNLLEPEFYI